MDSEPDEENVICPMQLSFMVEPLAHQLRERTQSWSSPAPSSAFSASTHQPMKIVPPANLSPWRGPHLKRGRFYNPDTPKQNFSSFLRWITQRKPGYWEKYTASEPGPPPATRVEGDAVRVTFVNHSTFLIQTESFNLLTDPVWSERVSPVTFAGPRRHRAPGLNFHDLPPIDAILLSHNHYDHCDRETLRQLAQRDHPEIFCPLGLAGWLGKQGFQKIRELDWWQSVAWRGLRVHCLPAQHFAARGPFDRNRTLWCGWMTQSHAGEIYFAGDTGFGGFFKEIAADFRNIRLALLPIGAYEPEWFMGPIHMTPEQAVEVHRILEPHVSIATHFGTFSLADDGEFAPLQRLHAELDASPAATPFLVLREGESHDLQPAEAAAAMSTAVQD
jgi:L-ascorbate metabolism protein UlaG (beta-lactamase superfamily)